MLGSWEGQLAPFLTSYEIWGSAVSSPSEVGRSPGRRRGGAPTGGPATISCIALQACPKMAQFFLYASTQRHNWGLVGSLVIVLLQVLCWFWQWN